MFRSLNGRLKPLERASFSLSRQQTQVASASRTAHRADASLVCPHDVKTKLTTIFYEREMTRSPTVISSVSTLQSIQATIRLEL